VEEVQVLIEPWSRLWIPLVLMWSLAKTELRVL
jgi:hypothetical protein